MEITINIEVNDSRTEYVDLSEHGISPEEWEAKSEEDKKRWLYENVVNEIETAEWFIDYIEES